MPCFCGTKYGVLHIFLLRLLFFTLSLPPKKRIPLSISLFTSFLFGALTTDGSSLTYFLPIFLMTVICRTTSLYFYTKMIWGHHTISGGGSRRQTEQASNRTDGKEITHNRILNHVLFSSYDEFISRVIKHYHEIIRSSFIRWFLILIMIFFFSCHPFSL